MLGQLCRRRHRRHCHHAYVPMSNTTSHDNHEKINSWVSFSFLYEYGAPLGSPGAPLIFVSEVCPQRFLSERVHIKLIFHLI